MVIVKYIGGKQLSIRSRFFILIATLNVNMKIFFFSSQKLLFSTLKPPKQLISLQL